MPRDRKRYLELVLAQSLKWAAAVSLLGMRQTGKTTLLKKIGSSYFTFDDPDLQGRVEREGQALLDGSKPPVVFDEAQKYPPIFDRIKLSIDQKKRPGKFLLSGSVRFSAKRNIKESLTGRGTVLELRPFNLSESYSEPLSTFVERLKKGSRPLSLARFKHKYIAHYVQVGGLPGICFNRSSAIRSKQMRQHLDTLLSRDLQFLYRTRVTLVKAQSILRDLAKSEGQEFFSSRIARKHGMTAPTFIRLLDAFEGLFLLRRYDRYVFLEDQGIKHFIDPVVLENFEESHWIGLVTRELSTQCSYLDKEEMALSSYSTPGGAHVPWVLSARGQEIAGITMDASDYPSEKSLKSLGSFAKIQPDCITIALHLGTKEFIAGRSILCLPVTSVF